MQATYTVEGILSERIFDNKEQFLVRWGGNYKPSWEPAHVIKSDCPALVEEFLKVSISFVFEGTFLL